MSIKQGENDFAERTQRLIVFASAMKRPVQGTAAIHEDRDRGVEQIKQKISQVVVLMGTDIACLGSTTRRCALSPSQRWSFACGTYRSLVVNKEHSAHTMFLRSNMDVQARFLGHLDQIILPHNEGQTVFSVQKLCTFLDVTAFCNRKLKCESCSLQSSQKYMDNGIFDVSFKHAKMTRLLLKKSKAMFSRISNKHQYENHKICASAGYTKKKSKHV